MTRDEAMAKVTELLDESFAKMMDDAEIVFVDFGATPDQIARGLENYSAILADERSRRLVEMRGWLERDGESLQ